MSAKHQATAYKRNAAAIRAAVSRAHAAGEPVGCGRCGRAIIPGQPFDIGHRDPDGGHDRSNLRPEHRHATSYCQGNRAEGGARGAAITNRTRLSNVRSLNVTERAI